MNESSQNRQIAEELRQVYSQLGEAYFDRIKNLIETSATKIEELSAIKERAVRVWTQAEPFGPSDVTANVGEAMRHVIFGEGAPGLRQPESPPAAEGETAETADGDGDGK
jgi:hypothetical protein